MALHRRAAARDANEPEIRKAFAAHGWHTEQRSDAGGWDLDCYPTMHPNVRGVGRVVIHVDVKTKTGKVTEAQEEKWAALAEKDVPVYVVRTAEDVAALVRGELAAWEPDPDLHTGRCGRDGCRALRPCRKHDVGGTRSGVRKPNYTPPTGTGMGGCIVDQDPPLDMAALARADPSCPYETCSGDCEHNRV